MKIHWDFADIVTDFDKSILEDYDWILKNISTIEYLELSIVHPWQVILALSNTHLARTCSY